MARKSELWEISPERWRELYWGEEKPSVIELSRRFGVGDGVVRRIFKAKGIKLRSNAEQQKIEYRAGRHRPPDRKGKTPSTAATQRRNTGAGMRAAHSPEAIRRLALSLQRSETRRCCWCGASVTKIPSAFRTERVYCSLSCSAYHRWHLRRDPEAPRPLLLEKMRDALGKGRVTGERLERLAEEIGAGDPEIIAVMMSA